MSEYHSQVPAGRVNPETQQIDYQCYGDAEVGQDREGKPVCRKKRLAKNKSSSGWNWTAIIVSLVLILLLVLAVLSVARPGWHRRFLPRRPAVILRA